MFESLTFAVVTLFCAFSPIIVPLSMIFLSLYCCLSISILISVMYVCWLYIDRERGWKGGRYNHWIRGWKIWQVWVNYFPLHLVKTVDLDANVNYIFACHPHGVGSLGAVGNFGTNATGFSRLFPNIRPHLMLLPFQFFNPLTRDLLLGLGKSQLICIEIDRLNNNCRCMFCITFEL